MGDTGVTLTESCEGLSSATVVPTTHSLGFHFIFIYFFLGGGEKVGRGPGLGVTFIPLLRLVLKYVP